ncbi:MAG: hypothetical protein ACYC61_29725 [Isosphaeraceae bacterium]
MIRRVPGRAIVLGSSCLGLLLAGCEPRHSWSRKGDDMMSRYADDDSSSPSKVIGGSADDVSPRSFFKNNRSSGGWSSEAREIESHLGAP